MFQLAVIMPVYNEEGAVTRVIQKWTNELKRINIKFQIHAYNDGSTDNTSRILNEIAKNNDNLIVHNKKNTGHGPTLVVGYRNISDAEWIFQMDSDDEISEDEFEELWNKRSKYDFLIGERIYSGRPLSRNIISTVSRITVRAFFGNSVHDVNSPYRLMRHEKFEGIYRQLPNNMFAPNVAISGFVALNKYQVFTTVVHHKNRSTGKLSLVKWKLFKGAIKSLIQTIMFRISL